MAEDKPETKTDPKPDPKPDPKVKVDPAPEPEATVQVAYVGNKRVHHTLTGKVFEYGTLHTLTESEWRDLQARTADDDFEIV